MLTPWNPNVQSWPGGRVSALAAGGGRVYIGGLFDEVGLSGATNLEVVDATTGARIPWSGSASGEVLALILNGGTLYAGGQFTSLGGVTRNRIGAIDAATGFATGWAPEAFGNFPDVWALALSGSTIYAGGHFDEIGGEARQNIAALDATTGLATAWNPNASGMVRALAVDGGTVYAGGSFGSIGGAGPFLAALDATTGLATSWNPDVYADIYTLAIGYGVLYAGGELGVVGNLPRQGVAEIDLVTGLATAWDPNPSVGNGYIQALAVVGSSVHVGGHFHDIAGEPRSGIACLSPADVSAVSGEEAATPEFGLSLAGGAASSVRIRYSLPEAGPVQVRVFDVQGRLLATPVDGTREAGTHEFTWDKRGSNGRLASGLYFVRLETARQKTTGRLVIAR
jgi:hypothetical protein